MVPHSTVQSGPVAGVCVSIYGTSWCSVEADLGPRNMVAGIQQMYVQQAILAFIRAKTKSPGFSSREVKGGCRASWSWINKFSLVPGLADV